jgi:hypothetical protein
MTVASEALRVLASTCIGRRNDHALQRPDRGYRRQFAPLTYDLLRAHLAGALTLGNYVIDEQGTCRYALVDSDRRGGLADLVEVQQRLAVDGASSYLEASRRGGHLWVFLASLVEPGSLRRWLGSYVSVDMELYPKQETGTWQHPGALVRVPLGVHQATGARYPFVQVVKQNGARHLVPVASSLQDTLAWLALVRRATVPAALKQPTTNAANEPDPQKKYSSKMAEPDAVPPSLTIRDWCVQQDALAVIGRYVELDRGGLGCCPFAEHHAHGRDRHPSLWVHAPRFPDVCCWYCHTWRRGGSLFDFLKLYHQLDALTLWRRLRAGERL